MNIEKKIGMVYTKQYWKRHQKVNRKIASTSETRFADSQIVSARFNV